MFLPDPASRKLLALEFATARQGAAKSSRPRRSVLGALPSPRRRERRAPHAVAPAGGC
jgi:hypothetical protein